MKIREIKFYYGSLDECTFDEKLHPTIQKELLINFLLDDNKTIIKSNSQYLLNLAILLHSYSYNEIPYHNIKIPKFNLRHFEIAVDNSIIEGDYYKGIISDDNLLNTNVNKLNTEFGDLLDLLEVNKKN